jgi:hypothetical protein
MINKDYMLHCFLHESKYKSLFKQFKYCLRQPYIFFEFQRVSLITRAHAIFLLEQELSQCCYCRSIAAHGADERSSSVLILGHAVFVKNVSARQHYNLQESLSAEWLQLVRRVEKQHQIKMKLTSLPCIVSSSSEQMAQMASLANTLVPAGE